MGGLQCFPDTPRDCTRERHGHRIANQPGSSADMPWFARFEKFIPRGKRLEQGGFSQRNCAILLRVPKTPVAEARALGGDGRGKFIPGHAPVDTPIPTAGRFFDDKRRRDRGPIPRQDMPGLEARIRARFVGDRRLDVCSGSAVSLFAGADGCQVADGVRAR